MIAGYVSLDNSSNKPDNNGAIIDPSLLAQLQIPTAEFLTSVGNASGVMAY